MLVAIGITNQRETTVVWDRITGLPLYNAIGLYAICTVILLTFSDLLNLCMNVPHILIIYEAYNYCLLYICQLCTRKSILYVPSTAGIL